MKSYKTYIMGILLLISVSSCFEDMTEKFEQTQIEFENAVMLSRAPGQVFPIINVTRTAGTPEYQVNLVGRHLNTQADIAYSLDEVPASLLNATTIEAVEGVHFTLAGDSFSFPVNASTTKFNGLTINPAFPAQAGMTALLILKLDGNETIAPAENFRRLGIKINLN